jgi:hypothetical protein
VIIEALPPSPRRDRHRGEFLPIGSWGAILGLPAINLSTSFLPSPKAAPGVLAITNWIGAWPANVSLQTRQSLASQVTSQIVRPEINVTFRYNPKKVRRAWGISQIIIDLILGWFLETTQMQTRGARNCFLKTFYTMFTRKKFGDRNEDCRFQRWHPSTNLYNVRLRKSFRAERKL